MNTYDNFVNKELGEGIKAVNIAEDLVSKFTNITYSETAQAIYFLVNKEMNAKPMEAVKVSSKMAVQEVKVKAFSKKVTDTLDDAMHFAWLMKEAYQKSNPLTPVQVAVYVNQYYALSANDLAAVIKHGGEQPVFPDISASDMVSLLKNSDLGYKNLTDDTLKGILKNVGYTQAEIDAAFGTPSNPRTIEPFGNREGTAVNDWPGAKGRGSIVKMTVNCGNILDGFQAFYGNGSMGMSYHGGERGGRHDIILDEGDCLVEMSGYYGQWYGREYILQVTFKSKNGKIYGPFGSMEYSSTQTPFSCMANEGEQIVAFSSYQMVGLEADGTDTNYITAIGLTFDTL